MYPRWQINTLLILAALAIASAAFVDIPLAQFIASHATPWTNDIAHMLEKVGESQWVLGYSIITTVIAWRSWKSLAKRHAALFISVAASGILANIIKVIVCRPRPPLMLDQGAVVPQVFAFIVDWGWNSFPSGHATTGLSIAVAGSVAWPRLWWLMWILGLGIALGRVLYNVHYLSDVIAGSMVGMAVAWWVVNRLTLNNPSESAVTQ